MCRHGSGRGDAEGASERGRASSVRLPRGVGEELPPLLQHQLATELSCSGTRAEVCARPLLHSAQLQVVRLDHRHAGRRRLNPKIGGTRGERRHRRRCYRGGLGSRRARPERDDHAHPPARPQGGRLAQRDERRVVGHEPAIRQGQRAQPSAREDGRRGRRGFDRLPHLGIARSGQPVLKIAQCPADRGRQPVLGCEQLPLPPLEPPAQPALHGRERAPPPRRPGARLLIPRRPSVPPRQLRRPSSHLARLTGAGGLSRQPAHPLEPKLGQPAP
mmetsp:Transcript_21177/g.66464  ORF Transcript_21177/g.66464 Transcript_21177/m.66464 type:complete len:274 (-) Transcript_21177:1018-1839(-)